MATNNNVFARICSDDTLIRDTYYSAIHRSTFTLNGEKGPWDIHHIEIPFSPQKEAELMRRFGLLREELLEFYGKFELAVVRHINIVKALSKIDAPSVRKSLVEYKSVQYFPKLASDGKQIGQDFYFIASPMDAFVGTDIIKPDGAYLEDINNLAIRLLQTAKALNENGFTLGALDLDSCFYSAVDEDGKRFLKLAYYFYSTSAEIEPDVYTKDVQMFISSDVAEGSAKQSLDSDVRMICAYIWTMLDGKHYTEPNQNAWTAQKYYSENPEEFPVSLLPRFVPEELGRILVSGMVNGAEGLKTLHTGIRQYNKRVASGTEENVYIAFAPPTYLEEQLPEKREEAAPDKEETSSSDNANTTDDDHKRVGAKMIIGIAAAVLIVLASMFASLYNLGIIKFTPREPQITQKNWTASAAQDIYLSNGRIVNAKLEEYPEYKLDEDGNIVSTENPEQILYPKEYVSDYIYTENVQMIIVGKKFTKKTPVDQSEQILMDGIIDLRNIPNLYYDYSPDAANALAPALVERYHIQDHSIILMRDDPDNKDCFVAVMLIDWSLEPENNITFTGSSSNEAATSDLADSSLTANDNVINERPTYCVREVPSITETTLYKLQGEWRNNVEVKVLPSEALNQVITITSDDSDHCYFEVQTSDGKTAKTKSVRLNGKNTESLNFVVTATVEGKYLFTVESDDGATKKQIQMTFTRPDSYPEPSVPPRPSPTPIPVPELEITPTPTPVPTPEPTPWQPAYSGGGGYSGGAGYAGSGTTVTPISTPYTEPVQTPTPTEPPVFTPEPPKPLSSLISHVDLAVGQSFRLGDYLEGLEYGYVTAIPNPSGIIEINQSEGFLLIGLEPGDCVITISKGAESIVVTVHVD